MIRKVEVKNRTISQIVDEDGIIDGVKRITCNARSSYISADYKIGPGTQIYYFCNLYGKSSIGNDCTIGSYVEMQGNVSVGNNCRIGSYSFLCSGVTLEDDVFLGSAVVTINDRNPIPNNKNYIQEKTLIKKGVSVGSNVTLMCGITIGENAKIGAHSFVNKNIPANSTWVGVPAKPIKKKKVKDQP